MCHLGSSPLTRGKPGTEVVNSIDCGLIPAHAGKTLSRPLPPQRARAHPRARGENRQALAQLLAPGGSSPLTRGKRRLRCKALKLLGLIPAHAGKTSSLPTLPLKRGAHPRSRGENPLEETHTAMWVGSSPLTRGKPSRRRRSQSMARLIPAHAGKTVSSLYGSRSAAAHPRSRGENRMPGARTIRGLGSSPLTRGKRQDS